MSERGVFRNVFIPHTVMATIIERDIHHSHDTGSDSSSAALIVGVVALIVIAGLALFFFQLFPFNGATSAANDGGTINIDLPTGTPTPDSTQF